MSLQNNTLYVEAGATYTGATYLLKDPTTLQPMNLTGYTGRLQVRKSVRSSVAVIDIAPTIVGSAGTVSFSLSAALTTLLTDSRYVWGLEIYAPTTDPVIRVDEGDVIVSPEVVR